MAFLTINGWTVPVKDGGARLTYRQLGRQSRSYMGVLSGTYRSKVREWSLQTTIQDEATAEALEGLVDGTGHTWAFDNDLYSSKGLGPLTGYTATITAAGGKFVGFLTIPSGTTLVYQATNAYVPYTVLIWKKDLAGAWQHYALNTVGTQYKNGAVHVPGAGDSVANWLSQSGGYFTLEGKGIDGVATDAFYDNMVIVPYLMPASQIAAAYTEGAAGLPFSLLPAIRLTGDCVSDAYSGPISVLGEMNENEFVQANLDGAWQSNLRRMSFSLAEVKDVEQLP